MNISPILLALAPIAVHAGGWQIDTQTDPQSHKLLTSYTATSINDSGKQIQFSLQCESVDNEKLNVSWGESHAENTVSYDSLSLDLQFTGITFQPDEIVSVIWRPIWDEPSKGFSARIRQVNTLPDSVSAYHGDNSIHFRDVYTDAQVIRPTNKIALKVSTFYVDETWIIDTPDLNSVAEKLSSPEFCNGKVGHATYFQALSNTIKAAQQKEKERRGQYINELIPQSKNSSIN